VDAALLVIRRVPLPARAERVLADLLRDAARAPERRVRRLLAGRLGPGQLRDLGVDPGQPAGLVDAAGWRAIVTALPYPG
jgi:hypothetical protein